MYEFNWASVLCLLLSIHYGSVWEYVLHVSGSIYVTPSYTDDEDHLDCMLWCGLLYIVSHTSLILQSFITSVEQCAILLSLIILNGTKVLHCCVLLWIHSIICSEIILTYVVNSSVRQYAVPHSPVKQCVFHHFLFCLAVYFPL